MPDHTVYSDTLHGVTVIIDEYAYSELAVGGPKDWSGYIESQKALWKAWGVSPDA